MTTQTNTRQSVISFDRIQSSIDIPRMQASHVTLVGGPNGLGVGLARTGLGSATVVDFDHIDRTNPARQDLDAVDIGSPKAHAVAAAMRRANPDIRVECLRRDICTLSLREFDRRFGHTDLFVFATDSFPAQAFGNIQALRLNKPAVFIGMYQGARAGEIIYHVPGVTPACFRCIAQSRYEAFRQEQAASTNRTRISSEGGTIFDLHLVDAIAGQICVGILTRGADNRYGRLVGQLGNRNLLQVKIDPDYRLGSRDIFGEHLGNGPANFSFTTIALPMERNLGCPDCSSIDRGLGRTVVPPAAPPNRPDPVRSAVTV